jgi:hypothetical protein
MKCHGFEGNILQRKKQGIQDMKTCSLASIFIPIFLLLAVPQNSSRCDENRLYNLDGFYSQLDEYLKSYYDPGRINQYDPHDIRGHFSLARGGPENLFGSADMVYVLYALDELDERTTPEGRKEWAAFIQSCQDPDTGWFTRNRGLHRLGTSPFKEHSTAYAVSALLMLGEEPKYPLRSAQKITQSKEATERWLEGILWIYVWGGSHQGGGMGAALEMTGEAPGQWFEWYFDWLDKEVNPETGLWQRAPWNIFYTKPLLEEMGGAPHFWWVYHHRGRPLPYPEKIINTCLALQKPSGLWDDKGYTFCVDLDAIWSIHRAYLQLREQGIEYRKQDIKESFERYLETVCDILNRPDSLLEVYDNAHKLPGALAAIAEVQIFFSKTFGQQRLDTPKPLKQVLDVVAWL